MLMLHDFDLKLCWYLKDNLRAFFEDPRRTSLLNGVDQRLVDFIKFDLTEVDGFVRPSILLGGDEFNLLKNCCEPKLQLTGTWNGYQGLHSRHLLCRPEIAHRISEYEGQLWCERSGEYASQLESPSTTIKEGVEVIEDWVYEVRRYKLALGFQNLLPCPEGSIPTPLHQQALAVDTMACQETKHGEDFRSVIWNGTPYEFTALQAACVKILWEHWAKGTSSVGGQYVLENAVIADANVVTSARMSDVFRDHPAWGTMIIPGATRGSYRLSEK